MIVRGKCPKCQTHLRVVVATKKFDLDADQIERQREAAPEVEHDPQDGCENLAPWTKQDFSKNNKGEGGESEDDIGNHPSAK